MKTEKLVMVTVMVLVAAALVVVGSGMFERSIGGERDEHGCLGPAGYTWNETIGACVREWELNENQKEAARIAVDHEGFEYATTVVGVDTARCPGCFLVHLQKGTGRTPVDIMIESWEVV